MALSNEEIKDLQEKAEAYKSKSDSWGFNLLYHEKSLDCYDRIIDNTASHPHHYFNRAELKFLLALESIFHNLDDAIADISMAIKLEPDKGEYYRLRGEWLSLKLTEANCTSDKEKKLFLEKIASDYQACKQRNPTDPQAWLDLIEINILSHNFDDAISNYGDCKQYMKTEKEHLVRSWLGCLALALEGDSIEKEDEKPLYHQTIKLGDKGEALFERALIIKTFLDDGHLKESYGGKWKKAIEIHRLFENNFEVTPKFNIGNYILRDRYGCCSLIELKPIEDMHLVELTKVMQDIYEISTYRELKKKFDLFNRPTESGCEDAVAWYNKGVLLGHSGSYEAALEAFDTAIKLKPDDRSLAEIASFHKMNIFESLGRGREAFDIRVRMIRRSIFFEWYFELAKLSKQIDSEGDSAITWFKKGLLFRITGDYEEAQEAFDKAIAMDLSPVNGRIPGAKTSSITTACSKPFNNTDSKDHISLIGAAYFNKAAIFSALECDEEALNAYDRAIESQPYDKTLAAVAWFAKGKSFHLQDRYAAAVEAYKKAIEINHDFVEAWYEKAFMLHYHVKHPGCDQEALEAYDKAVELKPYHGIISGLSLEALTNKGHLLFDRLGRYEESLATYEKALRLTREKFSILLGKGKSLYQLKRYEAAIEAYNKVIEGSAFLSNFFISEAWYCKGLSYEKLNRYEAALNAFDEAIKGRSTNEVDALKMDWQCKASVLEKLGRHEESRQAFEKANSLTAEEVKK